jgi:hypothetical protein
MSEAILELIKGGAKVNEPLSNGLQPLFYTVSKPTLFKMLLDAGADPCKASHVAWTDWSDMRKNPSASPKLKFIREPIICEAAKFGVAETLQMLLDHGVSIEERDSRGNTPLLCAVNFANADTINFLLKHGASLQATNHAGQNAPDMAAARMNVDFVRTYDKTGRHHKILEDYPGDAKSPMVGKWSLESGTIFLRLNPKGDGEIKAGGQAFYSWSWTKTIAWKETMDKVIEITVYCPEIPRMPGDELESGLLEYHPENDTCILRWHDSAIKLVRVK